MGQVSVTVNGRNFMVACDDGQEDHVTELAVYIDGHVTELANSVGQVGDARLMLMASLLVTDELSEMINRVEALETEVADLRTNQGDHTRRADTAEVRVAEILESASKSLQDLTSRVEAISK
jgi:cell division protein ZapA